jgi:hypothetical protein
MTYNFPKNQDYHRLPYNILGIFPHEPGYSSTTDFSLPPIHPFLNTLSLSSGQKEGGRKEEKTGEKKRKNKLGEFPKWLD